MIKCKAIETSNIAFLNEALRNLGENKRILHITEMIGGGLVRVFYEDTPNKYVSVLSFETILPDVIQQRINSECKRIRNVEGGTVISIGDIEVVRGSVLVVIQYESNKE